MTKTLNDTVVSTDHIPTPSELLESSTIRELCRRHKVGLTTYFKLRKQGCGPKEWRVGKIVRISGSAEREWIERGEADAWREDA